MWYTAIGGALKITVYYDDKDMDLKAKLKELAGLRGTAYWNRSESEIGKMLLELAIEAELKRLQPES